jgi:hypothetical protein
MKNVAVTVVRFPDAKRGACAGASRENGPPRLRVIAEAGARGLRNARCVHLSLFAAQLVHLISDAARADRATGPARRIQWRFAGEFPLTRNGIRARRDPIRGKIAVLEYPRAANRRDVFERKPGCGYDCVMLAADPWQRVVSMYDTASRSDRPLDKVTVGSSDRPTT